MGMGRVIMDAFQKVFGGERKKSVKYATATTSVPKGNPITAGSFEKTRGAFGKPRWMRGLSDGVYQTFEGTNHERHKARYGKSVADQSVL